MNKCKGPLAGRRIAAIITVIVSLSAASSCLGQGTSIRGRVVNDSTKAVSGAQLTLIKAGKSQTTDAQGRFSITVPVSTILSSDPVFAMISLRNGILFFDVPEQLPAISVTVFDNKGRPVYRTRQVGAVKGAYSIEVLSGNMPAAVYHVELRIGDRSDVFTAVNLKTPAAGLAGMRTRPGKAVLKKVSSSSKVIDTLKVTKTGYLSAQIPVTSYADSLPDIILKSDYSTFELPPLTNEPVTGTTRYWDCCKPHCAGLTNMKICGLDGQPLSSNSGKSGCENGGTVFQCWNYAPIEINDKVAYGWAAYNSNNTTCGECYQLAFQDAALKGKQMIVQFINIGDGGPNFDLLIPGGGVGMLNGCSRQWGNKPLGTQYGGFHSTCGNNGDCILGMCKDAFGDKPDLMRGCEWYLDWFKMTSNPKVMFKKVSCPKEIIAVSGIGK